MKGLICGVIYMFMFFCYLTGMAVAANDGMAWFLFSLVFIPLPFVEGFMAIVGHLF